MLGVDNDSEVCAGDATERVRRRLEVAPAEVAADLRFGGIVWVVVVVGGSGGDGGGVCGVVWTMSLATLKKARAILTRSSNTIRSSQASYVIPLLSAQCARTKTSATYACKLALIVIVYFFVKFEDAARIRSRAAIAPLPWSSSQAGQSLISSLRYFFPITTHNSITTV